MEQPCTQSELGSQSASSLRARARPETPTSSIHSAQKVGEGRTNADRRANDDTAAQNRLVPARQPFLGLVMDTNPVNLPIKPQQTPGPGQQTHHMSVRIPRRQSWTCLLVFRTIVLRSRNCRPRSIDIVYSGFRRLFLLFTLPPNPAGPHPQPTPTDLRPRLGRPIPPMSTTSSRRLPKYSC